MTDLDRARMLAWYQQVREELAEEAARRNIRLRELACTLLTAVLSPDVSIFAQVGDGAIIAGTSGSYRPVIWPRSGEYANETTFITADAFDKDFECVRLQGPARAAARTGSG